MSNQKQSNSKLLGLIEKVINLAKIIGIPQLINEINRIQENYYQTPTILDYLTNAVCRQYKLSLNEFKNGTTRKGNRFYARVVFTEIATDFIHLQQREIAHKHLNCTPQQVNSYKKYVSNLDSKLIQDKRVIDVIHNIKQDINNNFFDNKLKIN